MNITRVGIDLAKNMFQAHGVDGRGMPILRKQLKRVQVLAHFVNLIPPCLIKMEVCDEAHCWERNLEQPRQRVKLMAPLFVKPYVKRNKNNAADAEHVAALLIHMLKNIVFSSATHGVGLDEKPPPAN